MVYDLLQDNLHIVIRFLGNKTLEFDADTAEEKYTICRLLGMILSPDVIEQNGKLVWWNFLARFHTYILMKNIFQSDDRNDKHTPN